MDNTEWTPPVTPTSELAILEPDDLLSEEELVIGPDGELQATEERARELTENIKKASEITLALIVKAHKMRAHLALGYTSWEAYVKEEFNLSKQRSYQLLHHHEAITKISEVAPEGTKLHFTERDTRVFYGELERLVDEVAEATDGMDPDEASDIVNQIVANATAPAVSTNDDYTFDDNTRDPDGMSTGQFAAFTESQYPDPPATGNTPSGPVDMSAYAIPDMDDDPASPAGGNLPNLRNAMADPIVHDTDDEDRDFNAAGGPLPSLTEVEQKRITLFTDFVTKMTSMPDAETFAMTIPGDTRADLASSLDRTIAWCTELKEYLDQ